MEKNIWNTIGMIFLVSNTLGILVLTEVIFFKFPYITAFILILTGTIYFNLNLFRIKKPLN